MKIRTTHEAEQGGQAQFLTADNTDLDTVTIIDLHAFYQFGGTRDEACDLAANVTQVVACCWNFNQETKVLSFYSGDLCGGKKLYEVEPHDIVIFAETEEIDGVSIFMVSEETFNQLIMHSHKGSDKIQQLFDLLGEIFDEENCEDCDDVDCPCHPDYKEETNGTEA